MATYTRLKTVEPQEPETESYTTCDICGKEIAQFRRHITRCEMCGRDVHNDGKHDCCGQDPNGEEGFPTCKICLAYSATYCEVLGECESQIEAERAQWHKQCQEHKYDDRERPRSVGEQVGFSNG